MFKSFTCVLQQDEKDCGVACISMILKYYKTEI
ncbi:cysteine peptidase family C39 domain-containing protein, partial [Enterococcus faecalis]